MKKVIEGSHAVSEAVRLADVKVIAAYPITPQSHITEAISEYCAEGKMDSRFILVESEHSAMAAMIGAASMGVRTFTATSSHGLALMHELLHWASGARLPIVMAEVNRALGPGWNIWMDQSDSLAQRDTGWIQFYCEDAQEVFDTTLMGFRLAEAVNLPVMVVLDAFFLSHTYETIDIPEQDQVQAFLPPYSPKVQLTLDDPCAMGQLVPPPFYMEMRHSIQRAMEAVEGHLEEIDGEYQDLFGRSYGFLDSMETQDAEIVIVLAGTAVSTCRQVITELRKTGEKVGLIKIKLFRPFPVDAIRKAMSSASKIAVIDRNASFGIGGIFAHEIRSALYNGEARPQVYSYITGLGGRDVSMNTIKEVYAHVKNAQAPGNDSVWIGLNEELITK